MKKKIYECPDCSEYCIRLESLVCASEWKNNSIEQMDEEDFEM
jgi:hypothetical protein